MRKIIFITIAVFITASLLAQDKTKKTVRSDSKITEYGVNEKGETVIINRGTLTSQNKVTIKKQRAAQTLETKKLEKSSEARITKSTKSTIPIATNYPHDSVEEQIKKIEQEIAIQKNSSSSDSGLRLQKLEKLLEEKKLEKVIGQ